MIWLIPLFLLIAGNPAAAILASIIIWVFID